MFFGSWTVRWPVSSARRAPEPGRGGRAPRRERRQDPHLGREPLRTWASGTQQAQDGKSVSLPVELFPRSVPQIVPFCPTCRHFSEFLRSHHFCKYQIEVLTSGTVYLADILFCESALFYFSEVKSDFLSPLSEHPGLTWECRGPLADNSVRGTRRFQTDQLGLSPVVSGLGCIRWPEDLHGVGDEGTRKVSVR